MNETANTLPNDISRLKSIIIDQQLRYKEEQCRHEKESHDYHNIIESKEQIIHSKEQIIHSKDQIIHSKEQIIQEQTAALCKSQAYAERLAEMLRLLRHQQFGPRSEKRIDKHLASPQIELFPDFFNEAESSDASYNESSEDESSTIEVKSHRRRGKPKRIKLPADLPREDIVIDLPEDEKFCPEGHELTCIGEDISEQLDVIPAKIKVIRTIRKKYACKTCEGYVNRALSPKVAIPKSIASAGLLSHVIVNKYADGLPLYRQERIWNRLGISIPRSTMASWMIKVGDLLTPLINLMDDELLDGDIIQSDETRVQVLSEEGKSAQSKSYMWVRGRHYPGAPPIVLFEYDPSRSKSVPNRLFEGYSGYFQSDGYAGYDALCLNENVTRVGCWAHVRRKFIDALKASKKGSGLANDMIERIKSLYGIEKEICDQTVEQRYHARQERSQSILDQIRTFLDDHRSKIPPKCKLGDALNYMHNQWEALIQYVRDGRLSIDNNMIENAIRPFAIGRKNWLFSKSVSGARSSAAIYSIMISATLNGHNEYAYFRYILDALPKAETIDDMEALLPHTLKPSQIPLP